MCCCCWGRICLAYSSLLRRPFSIPSAFMLILRRPRTKKRRCDESILFMHTYKYIVLVLDIVKGENRNYWFSRHIRRANIAGVALAFVYFTCAPCGWDGSYIPRQSRAEPFRYIHNLKMCLSVYVRSLQCMWDWSEHCKTC